MSTSIHEGIVEFAPSLYGAANDPMDTAIMRDGVANGLLHAADSMGQVRVNYFPIDSGFANNVDDFETTDTLVVGQWSRIGGSPFATWPITLRSDGTPYVLRVRIFGAVSATVATATFAVVVAPLTDSALELERDRDNVFTATATATTPAWLSGTSGTNSYTTRMEFTAEDSETWTREQGTFDAVSGASPVGIQQCLVSCVVFAKSTVAARLPRLYGLHVQEYYGS